jgi:hypothetical protein
MTGPEQRGSFEPFRRLIEKEQMRVEQAAFLAHLRQRNRSENEDGADTGEGPDVDIDDEELPL